ncbi:flagellar hook assembly protein FlgD [Arthrobacter sp. JSM 101049]|uniref:flagellar hook assembly protein FlgD n=1 Tax=Arthrobacter sp. JSM 101049 TaxID=929097 RepID=UPI003562E111
MTVPPIEASQIGTTAAPVRTPKKTMDSEVFMHLLVTQLANQDPSSPMDTNQMIAQTTQLASMERLNALSATQDTALAVQQRSAAASLIGREVTAAGDEPLTGVVTAVSFAGLEPTVTIGTTQVPYSQIASIRTTESAAGTETGDSTDTDPATGTEPPATTTA